MRYFVMTDLEGVVGVDSWSQIRHADDDFDEDAEREAKAELARETNACVSGIRSVDPDAEIDVYDGHGPGGLDADAIEDATYLDEGYRDVLSSGNYDAQFYVGQHAMAGTPYAPLRHTQSSLAVEYYKLDGTFIGEFGGGAILAAAAGTPTVFLAGDDKACLEAAMLVPEIETVAVKRGLGEEAADHFDPESACESIERRAAEAARRVDEIPPPSGFEPPYTVEVRYREPRDSSGPSQREGVDVEWVDDRTVRRTSDVLADVYP